VLSNTLRLQQGIQAPLPPVNLPPSSWPPRWRYGCRADQSTARAPPTPPAASQAALGANWMAVPFLTYSTGSANHYGGGLAIISEITPAVATGLRLDYLDGSVWMPSMSLQLQTHVPIGRLTLVPFAFSGRPLRFLGRRLALRSASSGRSGCPGRGLERRGSGRGGGSRALDQCRGTQARFGLIVRF